MNKRIIESYVKLLNTKKVYPKYMYSKMYEDRLMEYVKKECKNVLPEDNNHLLKYIKHILDNRLIDAEDIVLDEEFHQRVMDLACYLMNLEKDYTQTNWYSCVDKKLCDLFKAAIIYGNLNYQVENGDFSQWQFNGYDVTLGDLIKYTELAKKQSITNADVLLDILNSIESTLKQCKHGIIVECGVCCGSGQDFEDEAVCDTCNGDGTDSDGDECYECGGSGEVYRYFRCEECHGSGKVKAYGEDAINAVMDSESSILKDWNTKYFAIGQERFKLFEEILDMFFSETNN